MELIIYTKKDSSRVFKVWPTGEHIPSGFIKEAADYYFELRGVDNPFNVDLYIDDINQEALRPKDSNTAKWKWNPGFHAGLVNASIRFPPNKCINFEFITDPDIGKLTRIDYDTMIGEILEDTFSFFSLSSFKTSIEKGEGIKPPPIARLEYLKSRINELSYTVRKISNRPQRRLCGTSNSVPYYKAKKVTGVEVARSFQSGKVLYTDNANSRLPRGLKGLIPARIIKNQVENKTDIPEHREIKGCLISWSNWLLRIESRMSKDIKRFDKALDSEKLRLQESWILRIQKMRSELNFLITLPIFSGLPNSLSVPKLSALYKKESDYRNFYRLHREFNLGIANVFGEFLDLPLARTFELYEVWCFLRLLRAATQNVSNADGVDNLFDYKSNSDAISINTDSVSIKINERLVISYQRRYKEYWLSEDNNWVGSFSRTMVPDIVLSSPESENIEVIVLDAKYRIENGLNEAVSSIHTYRDAIVQGNESEKNKKVVKAAYLLSPGIKVDDTKDWKKLSMPGRLFHPDYRTNFKFGAVILRPGMSLSEIKEALDNIISDASCFSQNAG